MRFVTIEELGARLEEVLAVVESGQEVILTRDGREVLRFVPVEEPEPACPAK